MLLKLPADVVGMIINQFLQAHERLALRFVNKKLSSINVLRADKGEDTLKRALQWVAREGHLSLLQWFHSQLPRLVLNKDISLLYHAALRGHLDMLQWLRENEWPWNEWAYSYAARGGHLEVLQWLRQNRCPWNEYACSCAAQGGHLEVLKWLRQNGCPWDEYACSFAAQQGHLHGSAQVAAAERMPLE